MRQSTEPGFPLALQRDSGIALPAQLAEAIRRLARQEVLRPGEIVPSSRALARHLSVSRGTVISAFDQLLAEGWLTTVPGGATRINPLLPQLGTPAAGVPRVVSSNPPAPRVDLRPGRPLQDDLPSAEWRAAWRQAAAEPVDVPAPSLGLPALQAAVAEHLRRMRGVLVDPARIAVTSGGREGLALLLHAARIRSVGVEDPGFPGLRRVLSRHGIDMVSLPTDTRGLVTAALPTTAAPDAVIVTPSHQYPLGGTLPIDRRAALLEWAGRHGVRIIEDDYDSELRYTSEPLPALASLDAARVALLGTFSKTLTPALATGFLALPPDLVDAAATVRRDLGQPVGLVAQRALAGYLSSGALARHTQRMRRIYRRRRGLVMAALADVDGVRVNPMDGGLHAVLWLSRPEQPVIAALAQHGVAVASLADYWASEPERARPGLVLGYGGVAETDLRQALGIIRDVLATERPRKPLPGAD